MSFRSEGTGVTSEWCTQAGPPPVLLPSVPCVVRQVKPRGGEPRHAPQSRGERHRVPPVFWRHHARPAAAAARLIRPSCVWGFVGGDKWAGSAQGARVRGLWTQSCNGPAFGSPFCEEVTTCPSKYYLPRAPKMLGSRVVGSVAGGGQGEGGNTTPALLPAAKDDEGAGTFYSSRGVLLPASSGRSRATRHADPGSSATSSSTCHASGTSSTAHSAQ